MSNVTVLRADRPSAAPARDYLGPAEVISVLPHEIEVRLRGGAGAGLVARARLALAFPYEPATGDEVLVIGDAGGHYVIGVLQGTGRTSLAFQGDVDLRAEGGVLRLSSDRAVEVQAPDVTVLASKLHQIADSVANKYAVLRQTVTELLSVRAKESQTIVEGTSLTQAKTTTILTEGKTTINGKEIHLG